MGIPKFFRYLKRSPIFHGAIGDSFPEVDFFGIDLNGLIHPIIGEVFEIDVDDKDKKDKSLIAKVIDGKLIGDLDTYNDKIRIANNKIFNAIRGLTRTVKPSSVLYIAVDGPAPAAKAMQQSKRREITAHKRNPTQIFDKNSISPGTPFMNQFDDFMRKKLIEIKSEDSKDKNIFPESIVYSSHMVVGEGEHKIAEFLRTYPNADKKTVVIHGMDADLIMIYLLMLQHGGSIPKNKPKFRDIFLFRNNDKTFGIEVSINLRYIAQVLEKLYPQSTYPLFDFSLLLPLIGNDFLPRFITFERIENALDTLIYGYREFLDINPDGALTDEYFGNIVWKNVGNFFNFISDNYNSILLQAWALNSDDLVKSPSPLSEQCSQGLPNLDVKCFESNWYIYVFSSKVTEFIVIPTEVDINNMIESWLEGYVWVYNYYRYGINNINMRWYYPYHYAPLFSDMGGYILSSLDANTDTVNVSWEGPTINTITNPLSIPEQLLMIMPGLSLELVPESLRKLYDMGSPIYDLYPMNFYEDKNGLSDEHASIAILPFRDPLRIVDAIAHLDLNDDFFAQYELEDPLIITNVNDIFKTGIKKGKNPQYMRRTNPNFHARRGTYHSPNINKQYTTGDLNVQQSRSSYNTQQPRSSYNTQQSGPSYNSQQPRPSYKPQQPRPSYNSQQPRPSYNSQQPRPSHNSQQPGPSYNSQQPRSSYNSQQPRSSYNSQQPRPSYNSQQPRPSYNTHQPRGSYNEEQSNSSYGMSQPAYYYNSQQSPPNTQVLKPPGN